MITKPVVAALFGAALALPTPLWAESTEEGQPWYQIELFVFAQRDDNLMAELWDERVHAPTQWDGVIPLIATDFDPIASVAEASLTQDEPSTFDSSSLNPLLPPPPAQPAHPSVVPELYVDGAYRRLSTEELSLPLTAERWARQGYRPLFHAAWRQPTLERDQEHPIYLESDERLANGAPALQGSITLSLSRYLHFDSDLYFSTPLPLGWTSQRPLTAAEQAAHVAEETLTEQALLGPWDSFELNPSSTASLSSELIQPEVQHLTLHLAQSRRMRSGELHYIDHPMLGILLRVTPYERPVAEELPLLPTEPESTAVASPTSSAAIPATLQPQQ
ncbi:MAG TPA: CsiV family protein [Motiliproteus sp.]